MFDDDIPAGIDLGTTNSCIGVWDGKEVKIISNRIGERTTPSVIYLYKDKFIIGEHIQKDLISSNEAEKIYSIKRIIGQDYNDEGLLKEIENLHYNIHKNNETNKPMVRLKINGKDRDFSPEELSSYILKKLKEDAEKEISGTINEVVISVPAYFDDAQRSATIEAAKMAGLTVIRIINEPTAAALAYGLGQKFCPIKKELSSFSNIFKKNRKTRSSQNPEKNDDINNSQNYGSNIQNNVNNNINNNINNKASTFCLFQENDEIKNDLNNNNQNQINIIDNKIEKGKNVMIFDLGGGTFDLAILNLNQEKKEYEVKSKYSDKHLGGDDFDNELVKYCLGVFGKNIDEIDKKSKERLKKACEYTKKVLSKKKENEDDDENDEDIQVNIRIDNFVDGKDLMVPITKKQFEDEICKELFNRLSLHFNELLMGAKLTKEDIDEIILVGGSTRMPKVKKIIKNYFSCKSCKINENINPDEAVAYGATIQAAMLLTTGKNSVLNGVHLYDITPISLGTDVVNNSNEQKILKLGPAMSVIIPKWTRIPATRIRIYETIEDNQDNMQICIYEGENNYLKDNKFLDRFQLVDLPKKPKGEVKCEVKFTIDESNILTVTATEKSTGNKKIKVISNKEQINKNNNKLNLSLHQFKEIKKKHEKNVQKIIKIYKDSNNNGEKIKALESYNKIILDKITEINKDNKPENINENNIEKYFFYVYQLLESYEEILYLNDNEVKKKNIIIEIKKYIDIFKKKSCYYIKEIIYLFRLAEKEIFLEIFHYSIHILNESGLDYLNNLRKFSRYYAKIYFEEVIKLYNRYIILEDELYDDIKTEIDNEKKISEQNLTKVNSNAISLIYNSKNSRELINPLRDSNLINNWDTGFTYLKKNVNPDNQGLSHDDYNLILDELFRILDTVENQLGETRDEKSRNELIEEKGICLGNIAKIKYTFQNGTEYQKYNKTIEKCLKCAELCEKNTDDCNWYTEALMLQRELIDKIKENEDEIDEAEIMEKIQPIIETIDKFYNKSVERFVDYILAECPYDGYNKDTIPQNIDGDNYDKNYIDFLKRQYNPDKYPKNTKDEIIRYRKILYISQKLNNIPDHFFN